MFAVVCGVGREHTGTDGRVGGSGGIKKRCLTSGGVVVDPVRLSEQKGMLGDLTQSLLIALSHAR